MPEMDLRRVLIEIHRALREARIPHALIGGLALAAHRAGRATIDLDLLAEGERADDVEALVLARGYERLHRNEYVGNYLSADPVAGRIDFLFAQRETGRAMLARATLRPVLGEQIPVVDASDLIGLKVQSSSSDPARRHLDLADIQKLLRSAEVDLERVRGYFRLFDREKELDALLEQARAR